MNDDDNRDESIPDPLLSAWKNQRMLTRDSAFFRHDRFVDWIAEEERLAREEGIAAAMSEAELLEIAHSIQSHVAAAKSRVQRIHGSPRYQSPEVQGTPAQVATAAGNLGFAPFVDLAVAAGIGRELWDEEISSWVRLPHGIPKGTYVALKVHGESMMPLLHSGDVMVVRLDSPYSCGDIVIARLEDDGFVVKRVGRVDSQAIELVSINPAFGAVKIPRASQSIVGTVVLCWCDHQSPPNQSKAR